MEQVYVTDHSPVTFFAALADKINDGYYADDSTEGFPYFDMINEVKLTRNDKPSQRNDLSKSNTVVITAWHNSTFVLDVQDAILQGFEVVPESIQLGAPHQPHELVMVRKGKQVELPKAEETVEAPQAPVSAPEAEAVPAPTPVAESVPEEIVEAPAKEPVAVKPPVKHKGGRPPKSKEL